MKSKLNFKIALGSIALAAALLLSPKPAPAQNAPQSNPDDALQMVTGCLQAGPAADSYSLIDENGKLWDIHSTKVDFRPHVGHKVTLSGVIPEKPKNAAAPEDTSPQNHLNVTTLKMISETCKS